ncbi:MAG: hypothetical protein CMJ46_03170 [Planctomyces sp.]|nr:hypothetical protein [Planctomyces sp.]
MDTIPSPYAIRMQSGILFDIENPKTEDVCLEDIAHGLAHTIRFNRQCPVTYTVAQHSVLVSDCRGNIRNQRAALLHDAAEVYLADIARPQHPLFPQMKKYTWGVNQVIAERFGIALARFYSVDLQYWDDAVLKAEFEDLWGRYDEMPLVSREAIPPIEALGIDAAKQLFLDRAAELRLSTGFMSSSVVRSSGESA